MRRVAVLFLWLVLSANAREPGTTRLAERWARADANGDGQLDRGEAQRIARIRTRFDAIDANGDGRISVDELRAERAARARRGRAPARQAAASLVARADRDGDGAIDRAEAQSSYPRVAERFDAVDADRDGKLSAAEVERWLAGRRALRAGGK